jgi:hypothetical protein
MMFERRGRTAPHQVGEDLGGVFGLCEALRAPAQLEAGGWACSSVPGAAESMDGN